MKLDELEERVNKYGTGRKGRSEMLKYAQGNRLTASQSIKAKCYDCMGYYSDGDEDCGVITCPLYPFMPYRTGGVQKSRVMSEATKAKIMASKVKTGG